MDTSIQNSVSTPPQSNTVKPCFCCAVEAETHFKFYTLYLIFISGFDLIIALTLSFLSFRLSGLMTTIFDLPVLILSIIALVKYSGNKDYGQSFHVCFSLFIFVLFSIFVCLSIVSVLTLLILRSTSMLDNLIPAENMPMIWAAAGAYFVVYLPFAIFQIYWAYLYYVVVIGKRDENKLGVSGKSNEGSAQNATQVN